MKKMGPDDDPEAYMNTLEQMATATAWPPAQGAANLTPCLTGLVQEAVDTLMLEKAANYDVANMTVKVPILGTLNISETYLLATVAGSGFSQWEQHLTHR